MTQAIQQDAAAGNDNEANNEGHIPSEIELASNERLKFLEQIAETVDENRNQELIEAGLKQPEEQIAAAAAAPTQIDDPTKFKVKVKLDGKEEELTLDEVLRGFQKEAVASRRLNEATRILKEAEEKAKALESQQQVAAATDSGSGAGGNEDAVSVAKKAIGALMEGDDEAAAQALAELAAGRGIATQPQQVKPEQVAAEVKRQIEVEGALAEFEVEYKDVVSDPYLASMTNEFLKQELLSESDMAKALKAAGEKTRDWLKSKTGASTTTNEGATTTTNNDRLARKQGMDTVPSLSASAGTTAEEGEESVTDVVAQMRKARGLPA